MLGVENGPQHLEFYNEGKDNKPVSSVAQSNTSNIRFVYILAWFIPVLSTLKNYANSLRYRYLPFSSSFNTLL